MNINDISTVVRGTAWAWALLWLEGNKDWTPEDKSMCADEWNTVDGMDLNLYVDGGQLTVTAYMVIRDEDGNESTDTDNYVTLMTYPPKEITMKTDMTFNEWCEKFKPFKKYGVTDGGDIEFDTHGDDYAYVCAMDNHYVWTRVTGDDGMEYIVEGKHFINREVYYITSLPWTDGDSYEIPWRDADQLWCDGCGDPIEGEGVYPHTCLPCDVESACGGESAQLCATCNTKVQTFMDTRYRFSVQVLTGTVYEAFIWAKDEQEAVDIARREGHFLSPMWEECDVDRTVIVSDEHVYGFGVGHYRVAK